MYPKADAILTLLTNINNLNIVMLYNAIFLDSITSLCYSDEKQKYCVSLRRFLALHFTMSHDYQGAIKYGKHE